MQYQWIDDFFPFRKTDSEYSGGKARKVGIGDVRKRLDNG
jgi:hypothetical protein